MAGIGRRRRGASRGPRSGWPVVVLAALFVVSVAIRLPRLDRPLGEHHEWLTATVARNLAIWHADGAAHDRFLPIFTYPGAANKHIDNQSAGVADAAGNYYYTSYPVGGYVAPYLVFAVANARPTVRGLQLFNLAMEAVVVALLFALVRRVLPAPRDGPALVAAVLYLFSAETLWYHSNVYMSDMLAQTTFVATMWAALWWFDDRAGRLRPAALPVALFAFTMTEWLSVFVGLTLVGYALVTGRRRTATVGAVGASCAAAVLLTGAQFATIAGVRALLSAATGKVALRSGYGASSAAESGSPLQQVATVLRYYRAGYLPMIAVALALLLAAVAAGRLVGWRERERARVGAVPLPLGRECRLLAVLGTIPVLAHHVVFLDYSAQHDFSVLAAAPALSLAAGVGMWLLLHRTAAFPTVHRVAGAAAAAAMIGVAGYSTVQYLRTERSTYTDRYQRVGAEIARQAGPDQVVFLRIPGADAEQVGAFLKPQLVYYAGRNIASLDGAADPTVARNTARELVRRNGVPAGVIFTVEPTALAEGGAAEITGVERITVD